ncbi:glucose/quinate/shikimate family membrane-bound PQQ-dependent dehydrogenase [Marinivivus vitaminiproducens]|uniref:glucose/quinate/shikimate family membrane-bound PQQ-dependent dehydrogenase n=1 Tax=Marinivivus vitaminiproducens TaxID=3035935 RepID=UPI00279E2AEF|nr:glucose/quinate/shikimate family membrane-bound PQQ-dependent dehydrogenase [Geminicoccaceae bacterium SCSIO 64248]
MPAIVTGIVYALLGVILAAGGVWLVTLGGSWYYLLAGLGIVVTGALLIARRPAALWVYSAVLVGTLVWAVWEVGFDWWQLAPRGGLLVLLGIWLLLPWIDDHLDEGREDIPTFWQGAGVPLLVSVVLGLVAAGYAMIAPSGTPSGALPTEQRAEAPSDQGVPPDEWHAYGRTGYGQRYSPLDQINRQNVAQLEVAWTYHTGDIRRPIDPEETTYEVTPLKVDDTLYLCTPYNLVIALDAETGEERWTFDPQVPIDTMRQHQTCRGVSYHRAENAEPGAACTQRVFMPTADARLIALDAETGAICPSFGDNGTIDLHANMPNQSESSYYSTSPPVIAGGLIVIGGTVYDNVSVNETSGVIRAFDVDTGDLVWNWDSGNPDQTAPIAPDQTYTPNSPNSWSIFSVDDALGLVYVPLGNQPPDQWGANRTPNAERFSSSVVALDLATGQLRWSFQTVHHDLWDMDVPAQPTLVDLQMDQGVVPALVQPTKQGDIYVLDRRTGEPVLPVREEPAPQGAVEPDFTHPTQPRSALSLEPPPLRERDMWGVSLFDQLACRIQFHRLRYEGRYTPPSLQGTIVYPGNFGVMNWGGVAVDPVRQVLFAMPGYLAFTSRLIPRGDDTSRYVTEPQRLGLNENFGAPYAVTMGPFLSLLGLPCQAPPWGYVAGADLRTGEIAYMHKNGTVRDQAPVPLPIKMGVPGIGGPIITGGGVAFLSGTIDNYVRAYDLTTGRQIWEDRLPAGGQATPMTYTSSSGRQMVVVVAGGHGSLGTDAGDSIIAYALPEG